MMTLQEAEYETAMDELYREHKDQAIEEFTAERLNSFYLAHPHIAQPPFEALAEARNLIEGHTSAAQVFAAVATEVGLKDALLKPVVHGLVHSEPAAEIITEFTLRTRFDFFHKLLSEILSEHGGVDLKTYKRAGVAKNLWDEILEIQRCRHRVLHKAESSSPAQAEQAIAVAETILEKLFPTVVSHLGLHLHDGVRICGDQRCRYPGFLRAPRPA